MAIVVILFYNTLSATRKFLRRIFSVVEKVSSNDSIPRRGLTKHSRLIVVVFFLSDCSDVILLGALTL